MKWNSKRLWFAMVLIVLISSIWLFRPIPIEDELLQLQQPPQDQRMTHATPRESEVTKEIIPAEGAIKAHQNEVNRQREVKIAEIERRLNTSINFYGLVVDEANKPIEGATSRYILLNKISWNGSETLDGPQSKGNGTFELTGFNGARLTVYVNHPNYHSTPSSNQSFEYAPSPSRTDPLPDMPTSSRPAVFVLKNKLNAEALIHHERIETRLPMNGLSQSLDLRNGRLGESFESLRVTLVSEGASQPINTHQPYNWTATLQVSGGGIIERSDLLEFEAPASGYKPQIVIEMPASAPRWDSTITREFFLKFVKGTSARMRLRVGGKGFCVAQSYLNPTPGSRNLEYDPSKVVILTP